MTETTPTGRLQTRQSNTSSSILSKILVLVSNLLQILLFPLRRLSNILFPLHEYDGITNTADPAARAFVTYFQTFLPPPSNTPPSNTHAIMNPFQPTGYVKTLLEAHQRQKLCFIYLHSPLHKHSVTFCQRILSQPPIMELLSSQNVLAWGGSIHTADAAHVAELLHVSSYPYCALLHTSSNTTSPPRMDLVWSMEGFSPTSSIPLSSIQAGNTTPFSSGIIAVVRAYQSILDEQTRQRLIRQEEIRLRQEQDREFQEALLLDQQRERESREQQEEALRQQTQKELEEQLTIQRKEALIQSSRDLLEEEPVPKTPNTTRLRIVLPSGKKMERRFLSSHTMKHVMAFVRVWMYDHEIDIQNFVLSSNYPKKTFEEVDVSLEDAGLSPMAVLMIQDLDA